MATTRTPRPTRIPESTIDEVERRAAAERTKTPLAAAKAIYADDLPRGVHQKLNLILRALPENMRPEGTNKHFKYDYWTLDQISGFFRNRFADLGLTLTTDVESFDIREHPTKEGRSQLTTLLVLFTITDSDTGEQISGHGIGQGDDPGDKGANKAMSGALKYWLLKTFLVGGEDAEADDRTDRRSEPRRSEPTEERNVRIGPSNIEGIQRGGRANKTTDAQIRQIRTLARDLEWNATGAARRIAEWLGDELELPEAVEEHGDALVRYLENLDADDAGTIITRMIELRDSPDEEPHDDDAAPNTAAGREHWDDGDR
jgi:hypothetical protein